MLLVLMTTILLKNNLVNDLMDLRVLRCLIDIYLLLGCFFWGGGVLSFFFFLVFFDMQEYLGYWLIDLNFLSPSIGNFR